MSPNVVRFLALAAFWVPLHICLAVAVTPDPTGSVATLSGHVVHGAAFAYLTLALLHAHFPWSEAGRDEPNPRSRSASRPVAWLTVAATLWIFAFGVVIEVMQTFIAGRSGDLADLLSNAAGIVVGCALYGGWIRFGTLRYALASKSDYQQANS